MLSIPEQQTFGVDAQLHRITGKPIEQGSGALPPDEQAIGHWGEMQYQLAELTQRRKDHADKLASEMVRRSTMNADHNALRADDLIARQRSVYALAQQDTVVANCERQSAALAAEHEALAVTIAEVRAKLDEEGILEKYGAGAAGSWRGMIHSRGWSLPS